MRSWVGKILQANITSADNNRLLCALNEAGVYLRYITQVDALTVRVQFYAKDDKIVEKVVEKFGAQMQINRNNGKHFVIWTFIRRPFIILCVIVPLLLTAFLSEHVFFVRVIGNDTTPTRSILEAAEKAGIHFGAVRKDIRSEDVKNRLLEEIPNLQWVGINTSGTVATIQVREKSTQKKDDTSTVDYAVSSIVAARDGVLLSCNIVRGRGVCHVGQAVQKGQLLVSGYIDEDILVQGCRADAEITALTNRQTKVYALRKVIQRCDIQDMHVCYGLRVGKKEIKFCNHSGIYDATCVKMYKEESWKLPGGFELPIEWTIESIQRCDVIPSQLCENDGHRWLEKASSKYLLSQMVAGEILSEHVTFDCFENICVLTGNYACQELIGQVKYEEILE